MVGPIGITFAELSRHNMLIKVFCPSCGAEALLRAGEVKTERNKVTDFRRASYRCRCGGSGVAEYACPPDWIEDMKKPGG